MFDEKDLILEAKHVTRRFPAPGGRKLTACNDVSLPFYRGRTLGLTGESGCGSPPSCAFWSGWTPLPRGKFFSMGWI